MDVVVGTPGRMIDLMERKVLDLSAVRTVVLDEADEMLNMGFIEDIETILAATPARTPDGALLRHPAARASAAWPTATCATRSRSPSSTSTLTVAGIEQRYYLVNERTSCRP